MTKYIYTQLEEYSKCLTISLLVFPFKFLFFLARPKDNFLDNLTV